MVRAMTVQSNTIHNQEHEHENDMLKHGISYNEWLIKLLIKSNLKS